jgi:hypothetical protein
MTYTKPQLLNVKKASSAIMGSKIHVRSDNDSSSSTTAAYRSDE